MLKIHGDTLNIQRRGKYRCALPFSLYALEAQTLLPAASHPMTDSGLLEERRQHVQAFLACQGASEFISRLHAVFIGGSLAKGMADTLSDTDVCLIVSERHLIGCLEHLGLPYEHRQYEYRIDTEFPPDNKLDVRLISLESLENMIESFQSMTDLSASHQDCLANLQEGIYLHSTPEVDELIRRIDLSYEHASLIISDKLRYLKNYNLSKYLIRKDFFTYYEMLGILYAAFCHIFFAVNGQLFRGYRHLQRFSVRYEIYPSAVISAFSECFECATPAATDNLLIQLSGFTQALEEHL
ncbi:putative nucleotidyltransferase [Pseudomonas sp. W3I7]|uniref:hypothetical protein n=1 Tax=Pseudomonas sp. W3I7 TaxID=3042292 RepID=UPI00278EFA2E|nr:hypothetical protein [Pseudomonas sp. W3I7]MDQ0702864.1 putative nucleotidyltransferase [Pseudomonas sp. W3I7]